MAPAAKADKKRKDKCFENKENDQGQRICCVPEEKVFCSKPEITDQCSLVRVICSSGKCPKSGFMHEACFEKWEDLIVGFLAKQGRGRTWSDKQRYANVWANKGYDLVFKHCACDCGHGSYRKDLDFVQPKVADVAVAAGAVAAPPQGEAQDKKKKKKEKTSLKPKLNFSVLNVSGSYFGSLKQKEDELDCDLKLPNTKEPPPSIRVGQRLCSEKSDSPSPVPFIPGLNPNPVRTNISPPFPPPPMSKYKVDPDRFEKASSAPPQNPTEDGWVTVSKVGTNRRNSQQSLKLKGKNSFETFKAEFLDPDNTNNNLEAQKPKNPEESLIPRCNLDVHDPELLKKLRKKSQNSFSTCEPVDTNFPSLPMYQPPPSDKVYFESALKYERNDILDLKPSDQNFQKQVAGESNLAFPQYFGARPKSLPLGTASLGDRSPHPLHDFNKSTEEIYQSDEDISFEDLDKTIEKLCEASPCLTPKWSGSPPKTPTPNPDKEMNLIWEQTRKFEMELNSLKNENNSIPPETDNFSNSDGKRDKNGFIHCSSCLTVHSSLTDFTNHCQSIKHRDNVVWAQKLENTDLKADLASGWENFGKVVDNWEDRVDAQSETSAHESFSQLKPDPKFGKSQASAFEEVKRRALSRDIDAKSAINEVKKQVMQKKSKNKNSRPNTPDLAFEIDLLRKEVLNEKEAKERSFTEMEALRKEIIAENEARKRTLEELQILRNSKKNIEKQAVIVENTLKLEESEKLRFEKLLVNSTLLMKEKEEQISTLRKEKEEYLNKEKDTKTAATENICDIKSIEIELAETKELLTQEQQKNEANSKLIKKMKEKSEKSLLREKDSRLLAEKTAELAEKQLAREEQKNKNLENQLKKSDARVKDAETKVKEEARKRIVAELDLVDQQKKFNEISDKFVKQAAVLNEEKNDLAKAVNGLVKDKEILDDKVNKARAAATEKLQDFVNEETSKKILQDSEEIVKQSFLKAIESNEDFDCIEDVKKIFGMVKDVVQSPENINKDLFKSPVKFDVQKVKTEVKEYLDNRNQVTEQSFKMIFDGLVQEGLSKNDRIVNIESDDEEQTEVLKSDEIVLVETVEILEGLKDVQITNKMDSGPEEDKTADSEKTKSADSDEAKTADLEEAKTADSEEVKTADLEVAKTADPKVGNAVFDLFDEILGSRNTEENLESDEGWEMFDDELVIESSVFEEVKGGDMTDDVSNMVNEFFKDDVLKSCLTSIFNDAGVPELLNEEDCIMKNEFKLIDNLENETEELDEEDKSMYETIDNKADGGKVEDQSDHEDDSIPGLDRHPKLGLDDEIDPYLGPDKAGEFDDYEFDDDHGDEHDDYDFGHDQKDGKPLDYDEYDQGCPCKGEHNPNGSCKVSPLSRPTDPLRGPFYSEYFMEQEKAKAGPDTNPMTGEELIAQWNRLMELDTDPNLVQLPSLKSTLPPLLSKLSTCSLPPLPTSTTAVAPPARRFSSSISPDSTSNHTNTNFSSSTVNSTSQISAVSPQSLSPVFQPIESQNTNESSRLSCLEHSVGVLQSLVTTLGTQVSSLTNQLEDTNFQSGLLSRTVEMMQDRNCQLQRTVDTMQGRNSLLEKKLSDSNLKTGREQHSSTTSSTVSDVTGMKENLLDLLASCESFQTGFDKMTVRQTELENKLKTVTNNFDRSKAENKELKDQFGKLSDKFSSLSLEYQVDKSQTKAQLDNLGYNVAILTAKIPAESFSSTSGVRSEDTSENEEGLEKVDKNDGISPLPPLDTLKDIVSKVVFSREESSSTEAEAISSSSKAITNPSSTTTTTTTSSANKMKKFVYSSSAVNQPGFTHPTPAVVGGPVWMSPDGSMVAVPPTGVPPTSSHAPLTIPAPGTRPLYGISPGRGTLAPMGTMAQPYMNQQGGMVYPFNYTMHQGLNMFYR
eukprot:GFUD01015744.1.p1 GENE.GFUD01015744.1~~GFUD01015744.1.p1  ORF type:complete len:1900 (-),score=604.03 GFUD01015744.1:235-5934(-)